MFLELPPSVLEYRKIIFDIVICILFPCTRQIKLYIMQLLIKRKKKSCTINLHKISRYIPTHHGFFFSEKNPGFYAKLCLATCLFNWPVWFKHVETSVEIIRLCFVKFLPRQKIGIRKSTATLTRPILIISTYTLYILNKCLARSFTTISIVLRSKTNLFTTLIS